MPTALIVEDEPEANRLLSMLIQLRGYRTESAFTGRQALEMAQGEPPDIVFLDLMLPDKSGYDVCRELKSRRETSDVPVVIVTARLEGEARARSAQAGANEYVCKPYTPDQIFTTLATLGDLRRKGDDDEAGEPTD
jgi:DNA-binding response OmpR family regulator